MSSHPGIFDVPQRIPLAVQTAAAIRKAIEQGTWEEYLPSERRLCGLFQVSRPTIRTALHMLAKDQWLEIRQGRCNRLLSKERRATASQTRLVGLVTHEPVSHMAQTSYQSLAEMRTHLAEHGFGTEVFICPSEGGRGQRRKLEAFVRQNRVFCWVLLSVNKELQQWFADRSLRALVLGSCHPSVALPSLDVDYRSVCRHAAGVFLRNGHRRLALIVPGSGVAGDLASEQGFLDAAGKLTLETDGHAAHIVRHNGTPQGITTKLDALFKSPRPPTALLVAKTRHVFAVIIYLLKRGLSVPDAVSLIARDEDNLFESVYPLISHYHFGSDTLAHRLSRLMLKLVDQGYLAPEPNLIFPRFFAGGTVRNLTG